MKDLILDVIAVLGVLAASSGVYLQYGLAWALMFSGVAAFACAFLAAKGENDT